MAQYEVSHVGSGDLNQVAYAFMAGTLIYRNIFPAICKLIGDVTALL